MCTLLVDMTSNVSFLFSALSFFSQPKEKKSCIFFVAEERIFIAIRTAAQKKDDKKIEKKIHQKFQFFFVCQGEKIYVHKRKSEKDSDTDDDDDAICKRKKGGK